MPVEFLTDDEAATYGRYAGAPSKEELLAALRWVVRRCILTRLVVGEPGPSGLLHVLADRALVSHGELHSQIRRPFGEFVDRARLADPMPGY